MSTGLGECQTLIGCSQTPRVNLKTYDSQDVGLVAKHWHDLAKQTVLNLSTVQEGRLLSAGPVYVALGSTDSAFDKAFRDYLISTLTENGVVVSKRASKSVAVINFKAETYLYTDKEQEKSPLDKKSFWAFMYKFTGDWGDMSRDAREVSLFSLGLLWDILEAKNKTTDAEVVLTVTVEDFETVKYKKNTEFYIKRNDLMLYWTDKALYPTQITDNKVESNPLTSKMLEVTKK